MYKTAKEEINAYWENAIAERQQEKLAFSVTERGHKYDAALAGLRKDYFENQARMMQEQGVAPAYLDDEGKAVRPGLLDIFRFISNDPLSDARRQAYVQKQHEAGRNAWNPFGGALTPLESEGPGGTTGILSTRGRVRDVGDDAPVERRKGKLTDM